MTIVAAETALSASSRLGPPHRRTMGVGGYRLPQRIAEGSRLVDTGLRAGGLALRHSRFEVSAPERL